MGTPPTLQDFREELLKQNEPEAQEIALAIELFTDGSLNTFAKHTNVDTHSRLICYDILDLGKQLQPIDARFRERKIHDMTLRLDALYDTIVELEERIEDAKLKKSSIEMETITLDNIYKLMLNFGKLYDIISDEEKKSLITYLIKEIQIYPNGESEQPLKSIEFNFPIYRDGQEVRRLLWEKGNTVESIVLLSHKSPDSKINVKVEFGEDDDKISLNAIAERAKKYQPKPKITYKMIQEYVEKKYGFKVHTAYIAEVKRSLGLTMYDASNAVEELNQPRKHPPKEKVEAIKDALKYFEVI